MMMSLQEKFLNEIKKLIHNKNGKVEFIHINKTAGTSIEKALGLPSDHKTVRERIDRIGPEKWAERYTFSFIRNPWDKVLSHYNYRVSNNQTNLATNPLPFNEWVKKAYFDKNPQYHDKPKMFLPQTSWLENYDGVIDLNFIGRFEKIEHDFNHISKKLNTRVNLPHHKKSKKPGYRDAYDQETKEIVAEYFARDIEEFNYVF